MAERTPDELLDADMAEAWREYRDATRNQIGARYAEVEPWAWARLQQRRRAIRARRARIKRAS